MLTILPVAVITSSSQMFKTPSFYAIMRIFSREEHILPLTPNLPPQTALQIATHSATISIIVILLAS